MKYTNIVLIDDDIDDQEIFCDALAQVAQKVTCTALSNAKDALRQLEEKVITPDAIFLDLNMPIMNGEEFLKRIKMNQELEKIPVIIFSTSANPSTIAATLKMGAIDFITKPSSYNALVQILTPIF